jgi:tRNA U34 5-carboxymethylaminomethyl modifying enzyme MnmG/GidA
VVLTNGTFLNGFILAKSNLGEVEQEKVQRITEDLIKEGFEAGE